MRIVLLVLFLMSFFVLNAQSKKEQIEILNKRVDSLNEILVSERKINLDKSTKISELTNTISNLESSISSLNANMIKLTVESQSKITEIINLEAILKIKSDSLSQIINELDKLKNQKLINESSLNSGSIDDLVIEGKTYKTVKIGNQTWMAENLNVSTFRNGEPIPQAKTNKEWELAGKNKTPAWCYYKNDEKNGDKFGKLYNWYAISDYRGLAPEGWHIPAYFEYNQLFNKDSIGKSYDQLKSNEYWLPCDLLNEHYDKIEKIGFNSLPSGMRWGNGSFNEEFTSANFWTTSFMNFIDAWSDFCPFSIYFFDYNHAFSEISPGNCSEFENGMSIRLIKNN